MTVFQRLRRTAAIREFTGSRQHCAVVAACAEVLPPRNAIALDTLAGVRGEMARLYRLGLNGRIRSDELTRFIYALKEIRACLEAELLTDVQQRLALLSRDMDNHNGQRVPHQPAVSRN